MTLTRRSRFILIATVAYALFATIWIYFSDGLLGTLADPETITRLATAKGLVFVLVSALLLYRALHSVPPRDATEDKGEKIRLGPLGFTLAISILVIGTVAGLAYRTQSVRLQAAQIEKLGAITSLKVESIDLWLEERRSDLRAQSSNPATLALLQHWLNSPNQPDKARVENVLRVLRETHHYDQALILDAKGKLLIGSRQAEEEGDLAFVARQAVFANDVVMQDIHQDAGSRGPHLGFAAPLVLRDGEDRLLGVLYVDLSPRQFLFPSVEQWPLPGLSGESLLARREGDEVVFLSELRGENESAPGQRYPLSQEELPAVKALTSTGPSSGEAVDYRGQAVFFAARHVPGTPWVVVSKINRKEALADLETLTFKIGAVTALALLTTILFVALLWQRQKALALDEHAAQEKRQRDLEHQISAITAAVPGMVYSFRLGPDGEMTMPYVSDGFEVLFGIPRSTPEKNLGSSINLVVAADRSRVEASIHQSAERMSTWHCEFRIVNPVRGELHIAARSQPQKEADGGILWHGVMMDITESTLLAREAESSRSLMHSVMDNTPDAIFIKDCAGRYLLANDAAIFLSGKPAHEVLGHTAEHLFPADTAAEIARTDSKILADGTLRNFEETLKDAQGIARTYIITKGPLRDEHGQTIGLFGIYRDITERKRMEEELRQRNELMERMSQVAKVGGWGFDVATGQGAWTDEVARIHDLEPSPAATVGEGLGHFHGIYRLLIEEALHEAVEYGKPYDLELELVSAKGVRKWVRTVGRPVTESGKVVRVQGAMQDITDRKRAEESLHLRSYALEAAANAVMITNRDGIVEWVNPACSSLTGYTREELIGRNPRDFSRSGLQDKMLYDELWHTILEGRTWQGQLINRRKDGSHYYEDQTITPVRDAAGNISHFIAIKQDINERKHLEELHKGQARVMEMIAGNAPLKDTLSELILAVEARSPELMGSVLLYDEAGNCLREGAAPSLPADYNRQVDGILVAEGMGCCGTAAARVQQVVVEDIETDPLWDRFRDIARAHGLRACWSTPILDSNGILLGTFATYMPRPGKPSPEHEQLIRVATHTAAIGISAARANATLEASRRALARTQAMAHVGGWEADLVGGTSYNSPEASRINGLPAAAVPWDKFFSIVEPEDRPRMWKAWEDAVSNHVLYEVEYPIDVNGQKKWVQDRAEFEYDANDKPVRAIGMTLDITGLREAQLALEAQQADLEQTVIRRTAELESSRREAEHLAQVKSEFLANMSHEIRTPLNGVLGLAQIGFRDNAGRESQKTFARILDSGRLLLGIINDILDFSKIEAGRMQVESVSMDPRLVLGETMSMLRAQADAKNISLSYEIADDLPSRCMGDPLRIGQVLLNLISNAIKFTSEGGVRVIATREANSLAFTIKDTGIGLSEEQISRLFKPFEQADNSTTRRFGGTGLGLTISHRLVELMNGQLLVESQSGQGSTFRLRLPYLPAQELDAPAAEQEKPSTGPGLNGLRILVAEDNEINQLIIQDMLKAEGAEVTMVENGELALDHVRRLGPHAFDIVLTDIQMPVMDGYQTAREIHRMAPKLPIIGQTAHALAEERERCLDAGMVDHIAKPIDAARLVAMIRRHTGMTGSSAESPSAPDPLAVPAANSLIDWSALQAAYGKKPGFLDRLLGLALSSHGDFPDKLRTAAHAEDMKQIAFHAHTLKGVAGNMMASGLMEEARCVELAAKAEEGRAPQQALLLADRMAAFLDEITTHRQG